MKTLRTDDNKPLPDDYAMFSDAGNAAAKNIVTKVLSLPMDTSNHDLYRFMTDQMNVVATEHGEIWDTDVRDYMISTIERRSGRELSIYF